MNKRSRRSRKPSANEVGVRPLPGAPRRWDHSEVDARINGVGVSGGTNALCLWTNSTPTAIGLCRSNTADRPYSLGRLSSLVPAGSRPRSAIADAPRQRGGRRPGPRSVNTLDIVTSYEDGWRAETLLECHFGKASELARMQPFQCLRLQLLEGL